MEKTFPRLVQTGEGSSVNSTGSQFTEKTLPRLYQTREGSSKHSDSVIGSGSGIDARVAFWLVMFAIATYIKGHWHCTGGASLREPVAVPLDKVPQPPKEFHAQALDVVRAVDVRRGFLQTSTISFLCLLPAPPRERLLQPVAHRTKLPDVAKSACLFNAHASKHVVQSLWRVLLTAIRPPIRQFDPQFHSNSKQFRHEASNSAFPIMHKPKRCGNSVSR